MTKLPHSHVAPAIVVGGALAGMALWSGGYGQAASGWFALLGLWVCLLVVVWPGELVLGFERVLMFALLVALAGWIALTGLWSFSAPATMLEAERALLYVGCVGSLLLLVRPAWWEALLWGVVGAACAVALVALVRYLFWVSAPDPTQGNLLFLPIGYANALGGLVALPLPVLVASATGVLDRPRSTRLAAAALVPMAVALYLTQSRAAWLAAIVAVSYWLVRSAPRALRSAVAGTLIIPSIAVLVVAQLRLTDASTDGQAGRRMIAAGVIVFGTIVGSGARGPALRPRWVDRVPGRVGAMFMVGAGVTLALAWVRSGGLGDRRLYWRVGWEMFTRNPLGGTGAGSFAAKWLELRPVDRIVLDAHNLYLETLAELGAFGLLLLLGVLAVPLVRGLVTTQPLPSAAVAAYLVYLVHAFFEWDWEMPVVTVAGLAVGVAVVAGASPDRPVRAAASVRVLAAVGGLAAIAFTLASLVGQSAVAAAEHRLSLGDPVGAERPAQRARRLLPWASEPWIVLGDLRLGEGDRPAARAAYEHAIATDPHDWQSWLRLSLVSSGGRARVARARAAALNPVVFRLPPP